MKVEIELWQLLLGFIISVVSSFGLGAALGMAAKWAQKIIDGEKQ